MKRLVCFNRERYESVKGIAKSAGGRVVKKRSSKNLSAKIKKIEPVIPQSVKDGYKASNVALYLQNAPNWRWRRVNEWFEDLKEYYGVAK